MELTIQRWWRKTSSMKCLRNIFDYLKNKLCPCDLQTIVNYSRSISTVCKGDGAGLTGGVMNDMMLCSFFKQKLPEFSEYHKREADMKIKEVPFSFKKISGPSGLALDWSKNTNNDDERRCAKRASKRAKVSARKDKVAREKFSCPIMILNLKSAQWWKKGPMKPVGNITYTDTIPAGIYLVDNRYCKRNIKLSSNNKTNALINQQGVYLMLKRSMALKLFIALPTPNMELTFDILKAFSE